MTIAQLVALGLDRRAVSRWTRDGRLHALYRGVYAVGHVGLSQEARWLAAVLAHGEGAGLAGPSSEQHWRISRIPASGIYVVVPQARRARDGIRLLVSKTLEPRDIVMHKGIPVTHVARTLVDLTDTRTPHQLANVIYEAEYRRRFDVDATRRQLVRANGRHNVGVLKRALELNAAGSAGTRSALEDAFLALLDTAGIPEPLVNVEVAGEEADCVWHDLKLIAEVDGPGHQRARAKRADARKESVWRAAGYEIVRFSWREIERMPGDVVTRLRGALRRGRGPRPGRGGRR